MSYDTELASRVLAQLTREEGITTREMFGGLAFLLRGNLFVGVSGRRGLLVRVPPTELARALAQPYAEPMVMAGRPRPGWVRVAPEGLHPSAQLAGWVHLAAVHARGLPPKVACGTRPLATDGPARTVTTPSGRGAIRDFDTTSMWRTLDARRVERGLSWSAVTAEIWALSSVLNARRRDHPISRSTVSGMGQRGSTTCQHALAVLRWLGQPPEAFLRHGGTVPLTAPLPDCGPDRRLRWDLRRVFGALDGARRDRGLTWVEVARELRCTPGQLTGIRTARYAMGMDLAMRVVQWLGRPAADFILPAEW